MPFIQQLLLTIPVLPLALITVGSSVVLAIVTILLTHLILPSYNLKRDNRKAVIFFIIESLVYGLLLLSVLFNSWQDWKNTSLNVRREANCLIELYRSTETFLPEIKQEMQALLTEYSKSVINDEWKDLARSELNPRTTKIAKNMWSVYSNYSPKTETEKIFLMESIRKLIELRELRDARIIDSTTGIHPVLWMVLIMGQIITIASITFLEKDFKTKLMMTILFAILIGLMFFTILLFNFPFTGEPYVVSSKPFEQAMLNW